MDKILWCVFCAALVAPASAFPFLNSPKEDKADAIPTDVPASTLGYARQKAESANTNV